MTTITTAISEDHRDLMYFYQKILNAPDNEVATRWQNQFVLALSRYLVAKELIVHPTLEKISGEKGRIIVDKDRSEHHQIKEKLRTLQNLEAGAIDFASSLSSLIDDLAQYFIEEEMADLPTLDKSLSDEDSKSLARSFYRIKTVVPTRSHLVVPDKPPFNAIIALIYAPFDYLGDLFRRFPKKEPGPPN